MIFDDLRRKYVALTPEEWVRQHFVHYLTGHLGFPSGLLANEVQLQVGDKRLRCDTLLYNKQLQPQMIVEYKSPTITLTQKVFDQISAYNLLLHVDTWWCRTAFNTSVAAWTTRAGHFISFPTCPPIAICEAKAFSTTQKRPVFLSYL